jgi:hypothetical protein
LLTSMPKPCRGYIAVAACLAAMLASGGALAEELGGTWDLGSSPRGAAYFDTHSISFRLEEDAGGSVTLRPDRPEAIPASWEYATIRERDGFVFKDALIGRVLTGRVTMPSRLCPERSYAARGALEDNERRIRLTWRQTFESVPTIGPGDAPAIPAYHRIDTHQTWYFFREMLAVLQPAIAGNASSVHRGENDGVKLSIMQSTQGNVGALGIGVGYVGGGPYLDEHGVRRNGLHAGLAISVRDKLSAYQQPDVHEGQTLEAAGYRILIEKILPEDRGWVILRVWKPSH